MTNTETGTYTTCLPGSALAWRGWRWWYFIVGVAAFFLATSLPSMLGLTDVGAQLLQFTSYILIAIGVPVALARGIEPADLGLQRTNRWRVLWVALLCYGLFSLAVAIWTRMQAPGTDGSVLIELHIGENALRDAALLFSICIVGPVAEEFIFRGLFFRSLRDGMGQWRWMPKWLAVLLATLLSSYLFVTIHGGGVQEAQLPMLMLMGVLYALAYEFSGSLYAPVLAHVLNNTLAAWNELQGGVGSALSEPVWMTLLVAAPLLALALTWLIGKCIGAVPRWRIR